MAMTIKEQRAKHTEAARVAFARELAEEKAQAKAEEEARLDDEKAMSNPWMVAYMAYARNADAKASHLLFNARDAEEEAAELAKVATQILSAEGIGPSALRACKAATKAMAKSEKAWKAAAKAQANADAKSGKAAKAATKAMSKS